MVLGLGHGFGAWSWFWVFSRFLFVRFVQKLMHEHHFDMLVSVATKEYYIPTDLEE
jgi:hypothetical protein